MQPVQQNNIALCPQCRQAYGEPVKFTWWGGVLGPKLFHHVRCPACRYEYNSKSGKSNQTNIILYLLAGLLIGLVIGFLLYYKR